MATPGSPEAVAKGCSCPIMDNCHGRGYMGQKNVFSVTLGCIIHSSAYMSTDANAPRTKQKRYCYECESEIEGSVCYDCLNEQMLNGGAD